MLCSIHTGSKISVSPVIAGLLHKREIINRKDIRYIQIKKNEVYSDIQNEEITIVDKSLFFRFFPECDTISVLLEDRNKALKKLNDRILIQTINKELISVCTQCMDEFLAENLK